MAIGQDETGRNVLGTPVRLVEGLTTTDETGRRIPVMPVRVIETPTENVGGVLSAPLLVDAVADGPPEARDGFIRAALPVRVVDGFTTTNEVGRQVPVQAVRVLTGSLGGGVEAPEPYADDGPFAAVALRETPNLPNGQYDQLLLGGDGGARWRTVNVHNGRYETRDAATFERSLFFGPHTLEAADDALGGALLYAAVYNDIGGQEVGAQGCSFTQTAVLPYHSGDVFPAHQGVARDADYGYTSDTGSLRRWLVPADRSGPWALDVGGPSAGVGPESGTYVINGFSAGQHWGGIDAYDGLIWGTLATLGENVNYLVAVDRLTFALVHAYRIDVGLSGVAVDPVNRIIYGSIYEPLSYVARWDMDLLSEASDAAELNAPARLSDLIPAGYPWYRAQDVAYRDGRVYMFCQNRRAGALGVETGAGAGPLVGVLDVETGRQINEWQHPANIYPVAESVNQAGGNFDINGDLLLCYDGATTSYILYATTPTDIPTSKAGLPIFGAEGFKWGRRAADVRPAGAYTVVSVLTPNSVTLAPNGQRTAYVDNSLDANFLTRVNTGGVVQTKGVGSLSAGTVGTMAVGVPNVVISFFDPPNLLVGNRTLTSAKATVASSSAALAPKADVGFGCQASGTNRPDVTRHIDLVFNGALSDVQQDAILQKLANGELPGVFAALRATDALSADQKAAAEAAYA